MEITKAFIASFAPDSSSFSNGESLVRKGNFIKLCKDTENTVIFGECSGSGSKPYFVSVDFINPESPIARCSCPSRKIPCKHAIGIMIAFADGKAFAEAEIPEDIKSKREKIQKREEKQQKTAESDDSLDAPKKAKKTNAAALAKKIQSQLEGLSIAESLIITIVRDGFGGANAKTNAEIEKQARQMGDHFLPGVQQELLDLFFILSKEDREASYTQAYEQITRIYALIKKGREYLHQKLENPAMERDTKSEIEAALGHPWKLTELAEAGLAEQDARLVQLAFSVYENNAAKETVETGIWINLNDGFIGETKNIIPFKAKKHIAQQDSIMGVLYTSALYKYPGTINRRIRWEGYTLQDIRAEDYQKILEAAAPEFPPLLKQLKDQLKNPLSDKAPFSLVRFSNIGELEGDLLIEDAQGNSIVLKNADEEGWMPTVNTLRTIGSGAERYKAALLRFQYLSETGELVAAPITLINETSLIRLGF